MMFLDRIKKFLGISHAPKHLYRALNAAQKEELRDRLEDYGYMTSEFDFGGQLGVANTDSAGTRHAVRVLHLGDASDPIDIEGYACYVRYLLGPGPQMVVGGLPHKLFIEGKIFHD